MKSLSDAAFKALTADAEVMATREDGAGKVFRLSDGTICKLFRQKRGWSSAVWRPYARRFERAAARLRARGVPTVRVVEAFRLKSSGASGLRYEPLAGQCVREVVAERGEHAQLLGALATFIATLHDRGVYFRGLHFGNVVVDERGGFGLIDISDVRFTRGALGTHARVRNLRPILRYPEDVAAIESNAESRFIERYLEGIRAVETREREGLRAALGALHPVYRTS